jgi:hypothetical protein
MARLPLRIGILWRGDRKAGPSVPDARHGLAPLYKAFAQLPVELRAVVFEDGAIEEVRHEVLALDGVLVWVNPIQDGANRANLDAMLLDVASQGVWVSAHPAVIRQLGTKEVLFSTRDVGWSTDTGLYRTPEELSVGFPSWLHDRNRTVLKQGRGNGGNGVWKVELLETDAAADLDALVRVQDARSQDGSTETTTLGAFVTRCEEYFAWSGCLVAQAFQERLADGMVRCYLAHDQVVGFCHQWPRGLLNSDRLGSARAPSAMVGPDEPAYQALRDRMQADWVPQMTHILGIDRRSLPVIWDADFLYGPKAVSGEDTYVLCETNVSAVWPFPPMAAGTVAAAAVAGTRDFKSRRTVDGRVSADPLDSP